jgi:prepilin-type N-terminal cleavage/methylation domain-containing protein
MSFIHHRERAFTLVELLCAVAVVGLLCLLIVPVINASREGARRIHSVSNLRGIGVGMLNLINDNHGYLPYTRDAAFGNWWFTHLEPYVAEPVAGMPGALKGDVKSPAYVDPLVASNHRYMDYGANDFLLPVDRSGIPDNKYGRLHASIPVPGDIVMVMQSINSPVKNNGAWFVRVGEFIGDPNRTSEAPYDWSEGAILVLFADGRTEVMDWEIFKERRRELLSFDP